MNFFSNKAGSTLANQTEFIADKLIQDEVELTFLEASEIMAKSLAKSTVSSTISGASVASTMLPLDLGMHKVYNGDLNKFTTKINLNLANNQVGYINFSKNNKLCDWAQDKVLTVSREVISSKSKELAKMYKAAAQVSTCKFMLFDLTELVKELIHNVDNTSLKVVAFPCAIAISSALDLAATHRASNIKTWQAEALSNPHFKVPQPQTNWQYWRTIEIGMVSKFTRNYLGTVNLLVAKHSPELSYISLPVIVAGSNYLSLLSVRQLTSMDQEFNYKSLLTLHKDLIAKEGLRVCTKGLVPSIIHQYILGKVIISSSSTSANLVENCSEQLQLLSELDLHVSDYSSAMVFSAGAFESVADYLDDHKFDDACELQDSAMVISL